MRTKLLGSLAIVALATLIVVGASADENEFTWVAHDGQTIDLVGHKTMFFGDDGEVFDVSDLRDGESRTLGSGPKQVTVSRVGDDVTIVRIASDDEDKLEINCNASQDTCKIVTFDEDPNKVMIMIEKTRECIGGAGSGSGVGSGDSGGCSGLVGVNLEALGGANRHVIIKKIDCDEDGNCGGDFQEILHRFTGRSPDIMLDLGEGVHSPGAVFVHKGFDSSKVHLRCPEGDSTIHVDKEEAGDVFLCPKHSVPMEQIKTPRLMEIMIDD